MDDEIQRVAAVESRPMVSSAIWAAAACEVVNVQILEVGGQARGVVLYRVDLGGVAGVAALPWNCDASGMISAWVEGIETTFDIEDGGRPASLVRLWSLVLDKVMRQAPPWFEHVAAAIEARAPA